MGDRVNLDHLKPKRLDAVQHGPFSFGVVGPARGIGEHQAGAGKRGARQADRVLTDGSGIRDLGLVDCIRR